MKERATAAMTLAAAHLAILGSAKGKSDRETLMPEFGTGKTWLNSPPLTPADLRGKVVLVDFWTYTCINWLRTLPYLRAWAEKYGEQGLVVIGVHTPEFEFEKDVDNVRRAVDDMNVSYPVVIDSDYAIWRAFRNEYWPAAYYVDALGRIRDHHFGEGRYEECERTIQKLLDEVRSGNAGTPLVSVSGRGIEAEADWGSLRSLENYVGYARSENFASDGGAVFDKPHDYSAPPRLALNHWALSGNWTITARCAMLNEAGGVLTYRFHARDLHAVIAPRGPVRVRLRIDGEAPGPAHGGDIDEDGEATFTEQRLYQLIRQARPITERTCEITFLDPRVEIFAFTFG